MAVTCSNFFVQPVFAGTGDQVITTPGPKVMHAEPKGNTRSPTAPANTGCTIRLYVEEIRATAREEATRQGNKEDGG